MKTITLKRRDSDKFKALSKKKTADLIPTGPKEGILNQQYVLFSPHVALLIKKRKIITKKVRFPRWKQSHKAVVRQIDMIVTVDPYYHRPSKYQQKSIFAAIAESRADCIRILKYLRNIPGFQLSPSSLTYLKNNHYNVLMSIWFLGKSHVCKSLTEEISTYFANNSWNQAFFKALNLIDKQCVCIYLRFINSKYGSKHYSPITHSTNISTLPLLFRCLWYFNRQWNKTNAISKMLTSLLNHSGNNHHYNTIMFELTVRFYQLAPRQAVKALLNSVNKNNIQFIISFRAIAFTQEISWFIALQWIKR